MPKRQRSSTPRSDIWRHVSEEQDANSSNPKVTCQYCGDVWWHPSVSRVLKHLKKCTKLPIEVGNNLRDAGLFGEGENPHRKRQRQLPSEYSMSAEDSQHADILLAEAIYSSGVPFSFVSIQLLRSVVGTYTIQVENPAFQAFVSALRPAYTLPSRKDLAGRLLDQAYHMLKVQMDSILKKAAGQITIVSDSWTNQRTEALVNYIAVTRQHAIFVKTEATGSARHTHEAVAEGISRTVDALGGGEAVVAVTTDNVSNMSSSWPLLQQKYPRLLTLGCASHTVNLCVEDLFKLPQIRDLYSSAVELIKYFKYSYILTGLLTDEARSSNTKRCALSLAGKTCWQGRLDALVALRKNRAFIKAVLDKPSKCLPNQPDARQRTKYEQMQQLSANYCFWSDLTTLESLLEPFLQVTVALELTRPKASRIYGYFVHLLRYSCLTTSLSGELLREIIQRRFDQVHRPVFTVAYICDPLARSEREVYIPSQMQDEVADWLVLWYNDRQRAAAVWCELTNVLHRTGCFKNETRWEAFAYTPDPAEWWRAQDCSDDLKNLAIYSLSINPTSGAAERNWSTHQFLHSKVRNRLANPRVEKLVYLFQNLRVRDRITDEITEYFDSNEVEESEVNGVDTEGDEYGTPRGTHGTELAIMTLNSKEQDCDQGYNVV
jgi:hypothetical protein